MKKLLCPILAVLILLSLCACGKNPGDEPNNGQQLPPQMENPSQTELPPDSPTEPVTEPPTEPPTEPVQMPSTKPVEDGSLFPVIPGAFDEPEGQLFVYKSSTTMLFELDYSECKNLALYYFDLESLEITPVTEEETVASANNCTHIFYVKKADPTKVYATTLEDPSCTEVIYETEGSAINDLNVGIKQYANTALEIVEGNKRLVWLDLLTGESQVLMEQPYILRASVVTNGNAIDLGDGYEYLLSLDVIRFDGKQSEEEEKVKAYYYFRDSGLIIEETTPG